METPYTASALVLAYVLDSLARAGRDVGISIVAAGGIVVDDCCAGMLAVAPERIFPTTDPWPTPLFGDGNPCVEAPIAVDFVVAVYRCVPVFDSTGNRAAPVEVREAAYAGLLQDAALVWKALHDEQILSVDAYGDPAWLRGSASQTFTGEGDCIGCETRITFGMGASGWCLEPI